MIIDEITEMIWRKRREILIKENRDINLAIYIEIKIWFNMMSELNGKLFPDALDVYQHQGKTIMGFPIYRVITDGHGIKVLEL